MNIQVYIWCTAMQNLWHGFSEKRSNHSKPTSNFMMTSYVKNVWLNLCLQSAGYNLRVLYFWALVNRSFTSDAPLQVYVSVNGDNDDVYSAVFQHFWVSFLHKITE